MAQTGHAIQSDQMAQTDYTIQWRSGQLAQTEYKNNGDLLAQTDYAIMEI
jgi:hypothetical protein